MHCDFQTSSSAAVELEQFRKSEDNRTEQRHTSPPTPTVFVPPPPPTFTPPPPPALSFSKPTVMLTAGGNPESAREALLEAIRSGTGAERLRKVRIFSEFEAKLKGTSTYIASKGHKFLFSIIYIGNKTLQNNNQKWKSTTGWCEGFLKQFGHADNFIYYKQHIVLCISLWLHLMLWKICDTS